MEYILPAWISLGFVLISYIVLKPVFIGLKDCEYCDLHCSCDVK